MLKLLVMLLTAFFTVSAVAEQCNIVNNTGDLHFTNLRIGMLKTQNVRGKSYAVVKKSMHISAICNIANEVGVSYLAKNDGLTYGLNEGKGFYTLAIKEFHVNGRKISLSYHDTNQLATYLEPGKRASFSDTKNGDKSVDITLDVELFIDPFNAIDNISSTGEFVIDSN
ncbi:hypothetical protein [Escherichia coli]|uniref:hypothetical protein n=1 Tax=Escherichia coli TaxID=562 RepID=UPI0029C84128|nr:hypothetical protein [Escherichia coli]WOR72030.1 hypothetical protein R4V96_24455 [Escherichia coli]HCL7979511.1 hypothetical protein [Escherichia coli]